MLTVRTIKSALELPELNSRGTIKKFLFLALSLSLLLFISRLKIPPRSRFQSSFDIQIYSNYDSALAHDFHVATTASSLSSCSVFLQVSRRKFVSGLTASLFAGCGVAVAQFSGGKRKNSTRDSTSIAIFRSRLTTSQLSLSLLLGGGENPLLLALGFFCESRAQ